MSRRSKCRQREYGNECKIATWNVRGMFGKEHELVNVLNEYDLDVLGVCETKRKGCSELEMNGVLMLLSGVDVGVHAKCGVGVLLNERMKSCVRDFKCVSARILWVKLKVGLNRVFLVTVYGPNESESDLEKDAFWNDLNDVFDLCEAGEKKIVCGDLNGWVGRSRSDSENVLGRFGDPRVNDNGRRIVSFCVERNLFVSNTFFKHRNSHLYTWENVCSRSMIDFVLYDERLKSLVVDTRVKRGADVGTDHFLVVSRVRLGKLWRVKRSDLNEKMFRVKSYRLLSEEVSGRYKSRLLDVLPSCDPVFEYGVHDAWMIFKCAILKCASEVCGVMRVGKKAGDAWWNDDVRMAVCVKKKAYLKYLGVKDVPGRVRDECLRVYKEKKSLVKRMVRVAKERCDTAANERLSEDFMSNVKMFWASIRRMREPSAGSAKAVRSKNGVLLWDDCEVRDRWFEYFKDLYGSGASVNNSTYVSRDVNPSMDESITRMEVCLALSKLRNGKSAGVDGITAEMLKFGGERVVEWLVQICKLCWNNCVVPDDWKHAVIVPLFKGKGSITECTNHRAISLLSICGKLYGRILVDRVRSLTLERMNGMQAGFMPGRGCMDQIFTLRTVVERYLEKDRKLFCAFVDLQKAYDSVEREQLWNVLMNYGVKGRLLDSVRSLYVGSRAAVRVNGCLSDWFEINVGVKQGCVMSPWMFNLYMDVILSSAFCVEDGVRMGENVVQALAYADDVVVMAEDVQMLERMIVRLNVVSESMNLKMNVNKSKVLVFEKVVTSRTACVVTVNGESLEQVDEFVYLGSLFTSDGRMGREIDRRVAAGCKVMGALGKLVRNRQLSREVRLAVYNGVLVPALMYGSECWVWQKKDKSRVTAVEMRYLRGVCGITRRDRVTNEFVYAECDVKRNVVRRVADGQLRWFGHVERMSNERICKRVYVSDVHGDRMRGRPRNVWINMIENELRARAFVSGRRRRACIRRIVSLDEARELCLCRSVWRRMVLSE